MSPERQAIAALRRLHDLVEWKLRHGWESDEEVQDVCAQALTALTAERTPPSAQGGKCRGEFVDGGLRLCECSPGGGHVAVCPRSAVMQRGQAAPSSPPGDPPSLVTLVERWQTARKVVDDADYGKNGVPVELLEACSAAGEAVASWKRSAPPSDPERATQRQALDKKANDIIRALPAKCGHGAPLRHPLCVVCQAGAALEGYRAALDADAREIAALRHQEALIQARVGQRGVTDCSTPLFIQVQNIVEALDRADAEIAALRQQLQGIDDMLAMRPIAGALARYEHIASMVETLLRLDRSEQQLQAERTRAEQAETCAWEEDGDSTSYTTACGRHWQFTEDGPAENGTIYCHHCGRRIQLTPAER